jgi:hypothetical protein
VICDMTDSSDIRLTNGSTLLVGFLFVGLLARSKAF